MFWGHLWMKASSQGTPRKQRLQIMILNWSKSHNYPRMTCSHNISKNKKQKTKQAKKKICCSLSQLKKTRSNTIRCVCHVWKSEASSPSQACSRCNRCLIYYLLLIQVSINPHTSPINFSILSRLVQQRPGCSARPGIFRRPSQSMLTFVVFLWC